MWTDGQGEPNNQMSILAHTNSTRGSIIRIITDIYFLYGKSRAMAQEIVSGLSPRWPGFEPTPFYEKFVVPVYLGFLQYHCTSDSYFITKAT
jgi:hypothetical protein